MRVATRRARAYLRAAKPLLDPEWTQELRDELGWLGSELGAARDLDVLLEHVREEVAALGDEGEPLAGLVSALERDHAAARSAAVAALSDARYFALLDRLEGVEPELALEADSTLRRAVVGAVQADAQEGFRDLGSSSRDEELHAARILVKRARYSAELAENELGKRGEKFVEAAKHLQDVLGEHQDAAVAEERISAWAEQRAGRGGAGGEAARAGARPPQQARDAWPAAWKKLEKRARRAKP